MNEKIIGQMFYIFQNWQTLRKEQKSCHPFSMNRFEIGPQKKTKRLCRLQVFLGTLTTFTG